MAVPLDEFSNIFHADCTCRINLLRLLRMEQAGLEDVESMVSLLCELRAYAVETDFNLRKIETQIVGVEKLSIPCRVSGPDGSRSHLTAHGAIVRESMRVAAITFGKFTTTDDDAETVIRSRAAELLGRFSRCCPYPEELDSLAHRATREEILCRSGLEMEPHTPVTLRDIAHIFKAKKPRAIWEHMLSRKEFKSNYTAISAAVWSDKNVKDGTIKQAIVRTNKLLAMAGYDGVAIEDSLKNLSLIHGSIPLGK